jgi:hypothetical protein
MFLRQYALGLYGGYPARQDVLLWLPALEIRSGRAEAAFTLSDAVTTYRVLLHGHDASGRLGFAEGKLRVLPARK